jgi:hypothetical protein
MAENAENAAEYDAEIDATRLSMRDAERLAEILATDTEPNPALRAAAERYLKLVRSEEQA